MNFLRFLRWLYCQCDRNDRVGRTATLFFCQAPHWVAYRIDETWKDFGRRPALDNEALWREVETEFHRSQEEQAFLVGFLDTDEPESGYDTVEFGTRLEAEAYKAGMEFVNDSALEIFGVFTPAEWEAFKEKRVEALWG